MNRSEVLKLVDAGFQIKNPVQFGEKTDTGIHNIFSSRMISEFSGSDPEKIIRIAVLAHRNQEGLWEGDMSVKSPHILYGYYDFKSMEIDFIWQTELQCRMCEGDTYWKRNEDKGIGKVIRLVYIEYPK